MASQKTSVDVNWNPKAIDLENEVEFGDIQGEEAGKVYKLGRWSLPDTLALIQAKKVDFDTYGPTKTQHVQMTTAVRWKAMATTLWSKGVHRSPQQIKDKWEQLAPDFKKVHDYEMKMPSGRPSYFAMSPQEKKAQPRNRFPRSSLDQVLYIAMLEWYPKSIHSMDVGDLPVHSGTISKDCSESSIDYSTKKRRLSLKATDGALASIDKTRIELTQAMTGGYNRDDLRHKEIMEMEKHRLQSEELRHRDMVQLEQSRIASAAKTGKGYVDALLGLGDAMRAIASALANRQNPT